MLLNTSSGIFTPWEPKGMKGKQKDSYDWVDFLSFCEHHHLKTQKFFTTGKIFILFFSKISFWENLVTP